MSMKLISTILLILIQFSGCSFSFRANAAGCQGATCEVCVRQGLPCAWCLDEDFARDRCFSLKDSPTVCTKYEPLETPRFVREGEVKTPEHQIWPKTVKLRLRPGATVKFNISMSFELFVAMDLYILVDTSKTMGKYLERIKNQIMKLGKSLISHSGRRIGLGTFIDKPCLACSSPFQCENCQPPYLFKNEVSLTRSFEVFSNAVKRLKTTSNSDVQEAVLDAIHQAAVCEKIGWRHEAKVSKQILVLTDGKVKKAGDGRVRFMAMTRSLDCFVLTMVLAT